MVPGRTSFLFLLICSALLVHEARTSNRTFDIDYEKNTFLKDGVPFTYASGEIHYFRVPRVSWQDRLRKFRYAGLNAISTYVEWSLHEPTPGVYNFHGEADLVEFIKTAEKEGLLVILRPGPYICAERDFGGYPPWLLTINPKMKLRTSDPSHTFFIMRWFKILMGQMQPLLYGNGGPIIMVQVENEYGSYPVNDLNYLLWLRDLLRSFVGNAALLFTTDGPSKEMVTRGKIPGVFSTVDFGPTNSDVMKLYGNLRKIQPNGPLVNSEFYVGWITYWGEKFSTSAIPPIVKTMKDMINHNISFNCYMFHGGTNFGFMAGSDTISNFVSDITSYDYDAPISEAGDLTEKYFAIKEVLKEKYPVPSTLELLEQNKKGDYGSVTLKPIISLLNSPIGKEPVKSQFPLTMEEMGQKYGFVAYTTTIKTQPKDPCVLQVNVRDRALVMLDNVECSVLQYTFINETPLPVTVATGQNLTLLVENMGRRNYKLLTDCTKGLISNATLDGSLLQNWIIVGYPITTENIIKIERIAKSSDATSEPKADEILPGFYSESFQLPENEKAADTFLDMSQWGKGIVFINRFNLGRYWHIGPQKTLYVPGYYLKEFPATNRITILELHFTHPNLIVTFKAEPDLGNEKIKVAKVEGGQTPTKDISSNSLGKQASSTNAAKETTLQEGHSANASNAALQTSDTDVKPVNTSASNEPVVLRPEDN